MSLNSFHDFVGEAVNIAESAGQQGMTLRLMGALAVSHHCPKYRYLHEKMDRTKQKWYTEVEEDRGVIKIE